MQSYLAFRLRATLAAWGDIAVGGRRPSYNHPSKSAVIGLLAAGIGLSRDDTDKFSMLFDALSFATVVNAPGTLLTDFHTIQKPSEAAIQERNECGCFISRQDELSLSHNEVETILSWREYYCNPVYTMVVWERPGSKCCFSLDDLKAGLENPKYVLYAGRKACVLSAPLEPQILTCESLVEVVKQANFKCDQFFDGVVKMQEHPYLFFEGDPANAGVAGVWQLVTRRDAPVKRKNGGQWTFTNRNEWRVRL